MFKALVIFIFLTTFHAFSQHSTRISKLVQVERVQIEKLSIEEGNSVTYLPSEFAEDVLSLDKFNYLHDATIIQVYYVYTQYRLNPSFDQITLDTKRFRLLDEYFPEIILDPLIAWSILEQTGCQHYSEGDDYFHGFVIVHRPLPSPEQQQDELNRISAFLDNPNSVFVEPELDPIKRQINANSETSTTSVTADSVEVKTDQDAIYADGEYSMYLYLKNDMKNCEEVAFKRMDEWVDVSFEIDENGHVQNVIFNQAYSDAVKDQVSTALIAMPPWEPAIKNGAPISSQVNLEIRVSYSPTVKGMYKRDGLKPTFQNDKFTVEVPEEAQEMNLLVTDAVVTKRSTSVFKGLETLLGKKKIALVMDVTGSMSGNVAAMVFWINEHGQKEIPFTSYTFFNDGDNKNTNKKKIGETGGIYFTKMLADMSQNIKTAMQKGNGGERPENDIEAILYALENDEEADEILLIGDNYSEVRDLRLLPEVTKPVHVLLCAAPKAVRPDYLKIAYDTKGMFIINGKIMDLSTTVKGQKIIIQEVEYKFTGNEFKNLSNEENY